MPREPGEGRAAAVQRRGRWGEEGRRGNGLTSEGKRASQTDRQMQEGGEARDRRLDTAKDTAGVRYLPT